MRNILVVAPFVSLPGEPYFNRFLYLCYLWAKTYRVTLVTSSFYHPTKQQRDPNNEQLADLPFELVLIDEPGYRRNVSISRFRSHRAFHTGFKRWFLNRMASGSRFDVVHSAFPLISTNLTLGRLKSSFQYKLIVDVQDIWPDSIFSAIPALKKAEFLLSPLRNKAHQAYGYADGLVAVSKTYLDVARSRCPDTTGHVTYLGSDYQLIESVAAKPLNPDKVRLVYLGTLSHSYDIETLIRGLSLLAAQLSTVELHILGDGPDRKQLEQLAKTVLDQRSPQKIFFHGFLPYEDMVAFVKSCHFAVNPIVGSAAQSVTNKLSDYIAFGLPILSSQKNWESVELIKGQGGYLYEAGSPESFAAVAWQAVVERHTEGLTTTPAAEEHSSTTDRLFDRRVSYPEMTEFIERLCAASG